VTLLVTGATGWLGCHLVEHLAGRQPLRLLVRRGRFHSPLERLEHLFTGAARRALHSGAIEIVERDLTESLDDLSLELEAVVHLAARTDFRGRGVEDYRPTNVEGARRAAELAARAGCPLVYASTAYVAGDWPGVYHERDLDVGQHSNNAYERSKLEAETVVRSLARQHDIPLTVVRPGIVLPDSPRAGFVTGPGPLVHLELLANLTGNPSGAAREIRLAGDREGRVNLVPLDFVVRSLAELIARPRPGVHTYHLTARRSLRMAEIEAAVNARLEGIWVRIVAPAELDDPDRFERLLDRRSAMYRPYNALRGSFDRRCLERELAADDGADEAWLGRVFAGHLRAWRAAGRNGTTDGAPPPTRDAVRLKSYFDGFLPSKIGRNLVPGLETLTADFTVTIDGHGSHRLRIERGALALVERAEGPSSNYDYLLDPTSFLAAAAGLARPTELFFEKKVRVRGNLYEALATATALEDFFRLYPFRAERCEDRIA